jgi:asparagine synthase (glutamine-hydrolysing)
MCGIFGVYNYANSSVPVTPDLLERLRDTMTHRGPDDAGLWINPNGRLGLAHRRLSIIDLSPDGRQPMTNEDGTVWITFNGEIYNYRELRGPLERKQHRFRSHSDTESILHLYEDFGLDCVTHLDGMFAFGLWDETKQTLLLVRDRLGVKPLYYTQQQGVFLFASEIKALLGHPLVKRDVESEALYHYLTFKTAPAPLTLFAGIYKLPAGCYLTCDRQGQVKVTPYWDAVSPERPPIRHGSKKEAVRQVRKLLTDAAIKRQMAADVPVGVFLSGGLDSSAVVALIAGQEARPLNTFSIGIDDVDGCNELEYARQVSRQFATNHHEILIGRGELEEYLPQLVHHQDEPLADPVCVPLYYLSKLARQTGTIVVQVGEGSDEQFLGYDSRIEFLQNYARRWRPLLALPRGMLWGLHATATLVHGATGRGSRYCQVLEKAARGSELFWGSVAFEEEAKADVLNGHPGLEAYDSQAVVTETLLPLRTAWPRADIATQMAYLDIKVRLAELLLMRIDKVTMSCGVEAREPFLDYRLVEYLMTLPLSFKLQGWDPKHLLKRAMRGLVPDNILRRPKQAFAAPVNRWLRSGLEQFARHVLLHSKLRQRGYFRYDAIERMLADHVSGKKDFGVRLWTLMNLSAWYDHWIAA